MEPVKETPEIRVSAEAFMRNSREYVETRLNLMILDAQEKIADTASGIVMGAVLGIIGLFLLFFLSIGAAWYIGEVTGKPFIGFLGVAGFYALIGIIIYVFRAQWIQMPVADGLIKKITVNEED